jgi:hypothetical protein
MIYTNSAGIKPIGPIAPNVVPALELSTLGCSSTRSNILHVSQRTIWPALPKADPVYEL